MIKKKILILGATGAMAVYLIPELIARGYYIDGVSLDDVENDNENITYIKADALDLMFLTETLKNGYDAIIDFKIYNPAEKFDLYYKLFLENTKHYIYFSTYRIYADDSPLNENAKRLLDVERPDDFVTPGEYSIYKAMQEDVLRNSGYRNYTILRPAITYSKRRFQLTVLEMDVVVYRMLSGKIVILPEGAMDKEATMSWAGDVAKMIAGVTLNPEAYEQTYNVSTSEHMKWRDVAKIYEKIGGLKYITVDNDTFIDIVADGNIYAKQQLLYDRCFDRIVDNSKILDLCSMSQNELVPLEEGLKRELLNINISMIKSNVKVNERMDKYIQDHFR